jgi:putative redox protein
MAHKVTTVWKENMLLESDNPSGHKILMETTPEFGGSGKGLSPKALMLSSLSGCTGLDVLSLLKKMRVEVAHFKIEVTAVLTEDHPKYYKKVNVIYIFSGNKLDKEKITKAVNLSVERYCGVFEMFRHFATVTTQIVYEEV